MNETQNPGGAAVLETALSSTDTATGLLESAQLLQELASSRPVLQEIKGATFTALPPDWQQQNLTEAIEKAQPKPNRKRGTVAVKDVPSLLLVLADQAKQGALATAYVYADPDSLAITAVFNDNRDADAGWRDYGVRFTAEHTPEFKRWLANSGADRAMSQADFAEFVEDNFADITAPGAQLLLDIATTIQATSGINFSSAKRLQDGQVQFVYNEVIDTKAGANGALTIPKTFDLGLRVFKNGEGYRLSARLKYRLNGHGGVKFWYELDRPERVVEDAFTGYIEQVRASGYAVLLGKGA